MTTPISLGVGALPAAAVNFGDGFGDEGGEAGFVQGLGQELLDDGDLAGFLGGELGAVALGELVDGVAGAA